MVKIDETAVPTTIDSHFIELYNRFRIGPALNLEESIPESLKKGTRYIALAYGYNGEIKPPIYFKESGIPLEDRQIFWNWYGLGQECRRIDEKKKIIS